MYQVWNINYRQSFIYGASDKELMNIRMNALTENLGYEQVFLQIAHDNRMISDKEYRKLDNAISELISFHRRVREVKGEVFEL